MSALMDKGHKDSEWVGQKFGKGMNQRTIDIALRPARSLPEGASWEILISSLNLQVRVILMNSTG